MIDKSLPYVLSDLDGTIAKGDSTMETQTIIDINDYQIASGDKFTFATGRSDIMCKEIIQSLNIKNPVISCNGGLIRDWKNKEILHVEYLNSAVAYNCIKEAKKLGLDIVGYDPNTIIVTPDSKRYRVWNGYNNRTEVEDYKVGFTMFDNLDLMAEAIKNEEVKLIKLLIDCSDDDKAKEAEALFYKYSDYLSYTWSGGGLIDAMKIGVSKRTGMMKYAEIMNTNPKDIIMFGDNYNDIDIVRYVNKGFAIGNAVQALKDVAYKTIDEDIFHNGVGIVLRKLMNHEEI